MSKVSNKWKDTSIALFLIAAIAIIAGLVVSGDYMIALVIIGATLFISGVLFRISANLLDSKEQSEQDNINENQPLLLLTPLLKVERLKQEEKRPRGRKRSKQCYCR